jgi:hypothetical protein
MNGTFFREAITEKLAIVGENMNEVQETDNVIHDFLSNITGPGPSTMDPLLDRLMDEERQLKNRRIHIQSIETSMSDLEDARSQISRMLGNGFVITVA